MASYAYNNADSISGLSRPQSAGSTARRKQFMDRMKDAGDTEGLLRKNNRRSLGMRSTSSATAGENGESEHDQDYLDHVRSIQVTPVQQQQAKQDALERASLASHGSSSSEEASRTRPSFDSVGFHSMASASSSRSQPANQPSLRPTPAVSSPQGRPLSPPPPRLLQQNGHHQQQHHHHQPKVGSPGQRSFASSNMNQSYKPQIAESTRSKRSRQRPTKPGGVAPSIASSSLLSPASILSQATSTSSYSAASTDYNPLTYRPSDAVRTYRTSETLRPIRDSSESQLALAPALFPAPLAPSYHPTLPVTTHFPRSYADDYSSSAVGGTMPSSSVTSFTPTNSEAFRASVPRGNSMSTIRGGRAPPPATGTNTPTNSVAWSDTDYHLENGRIVDQHDPSTYLPTLNKPERHRNKTHGPIFGSEAVERNVNNISRGWEKAKLDVRFGLFRTKQKLKRVGG